MAKCYLTYGSWKRENQIERGKQNPGIKFFPHTRNDIKIAWRKKISKEDLTMDEKREKDTHVWLMLTFDSTSRKKRKIRAYHL